MIDTYYIHDKFKVIEQELEGVNSWLWIKNDIECWDILLKDWTESHQHIWFNKVKSFGTVLQAGGCCGMYPRLLANRFGRVITFEPDPMSFHCLVNNCPTDAIIKMNSAIGNKNGLVALRRLEDNMGMNRIDDDVSDPVHKFIPMIKIDDLNLTNLDLIALDLEGYELNAIKGATETIMKHRPVIIAELGKNVWDHLQTLDYTVYMHSVSDTVFVPKE
jgi:FkbM family methyltransferase